MLDELHNDRHEELLRGASATGVAAMPPLFQIYASVLDVALRLNPFLAFWWR